MILAQLILGSPEWFGIAAAGALAGVAAILWSYSHSSALGARMAAAAKIAALLAVGLLLTEPLWSSERAKPGANLFVLLADNSRSMTIADPALGTTRLQMVRDKLTKEDALWTARLSETFQLRRYVFDARLRSTGAFDVLDGSGRATNLAGALEGIGQRFHGRPLAGILLFTDGLAEDLADTRILDGLPPVYPVLLPEANSLMDIALARVAVSQTVFEDAPVDLQCDVTALGYSASSRMKLAIVDAAGMLLQEQELPLGREGAATFRVHLRPESSGISLYRIRVGDAAEWEQFQLGRATREATLANNERWIAVDRGGGPFRVLHVAGQPNWDFKFIRRALQQDDQIQLTGLIRIARKEPKFDFRGRPGENTNPIYRGFEAEASEDAERYDQPVLARVGTEDEHELRDGFPKTEEDLYKFHAVVLDNVEAAFFTPDQMELLERFVSHRGGGLAMLGGHESFREGGYERTPLEEVLPVYLHRDQPAAAGGPFQLQLTREGYRQEWMRLRIHEVDERNRLAGMPGFRAANRVGAIKPGATVMAEIVDSADHRWPAVVVQRFGLGRSVAVTLADMWRWQMRGDDEKKEGDDYARLWRQTMRYLVSDVPSRVSLDVHSDADRPDEPVKLVAHVRDQKFEPMDDAEVRVDVQLPGGTRLQTRLEPAAGVLGEFETTFVPTEEGPYLAKGVVRDGAGAEIGTAQVGWISEPGYREFLHLERNRALLAQIAEATGGEVVPWDSLERFVESLPNRKVPIPQHHLTALWHRPLVLGLVMLCLVVEWGLRRRKGLP